MIYTPKIRAAFIVSTVVLLGFIAAFFMLPKIFAERVPEFFRQNFGATISVETANFSHFPPTLLLSNVHLFNPQAIAPGDAVTIAQIAIVFDGYHQNPMRITAIDIDNVHGRFVARDNGDNLAGLSNALTLRGQEAPNAALAQKVHLGVINLAHVNLQNEDGSIVQILPNGKMDLSVRQDVTLLQAVTDVADAVVRHQQTGVTSLRVENFSEKAGEKIKSFGKALKDYLTTPGPPPLPF